MATDEGRWEVRCQGGDAKEQRTQNIRGPRLMRHPWKKTI